MPACFRTVFIILLKSQCRGSFERRRKEIKKSRHEKNLPAQRVGYELSKFSAVLANPRAADDFRGCSAVREVFDLNRFAEGSPALTDDSGSRHDPNAAIIAPIAVFPAIVALAAVVAVVLRKIALRRSEGRGKSKSN
jgi:hypothetical protein